MNVRPLNTKTTLALLAALLLLFVASPTNALLNTTAKANACDDRSNFNGDMGCSYSCDVGQVSAVSVQGGGDLWGDASCGGSEAHCSNDIAGASCSQMSRDTSSTADTGDCSGNSSDGTGGHIFCGSTAPNGTGLLRTFLDGFAVVPSCQVVAPSLAGLGASSVVAKQWKKDGDLNSVVSWVWSAKAGCMLPPSAAARDT